MYFYSEWHFEIFCWEVLGHRGIWWLRQCGLLYQLLVKISMILAVFPLAWFLNIWNHPKDNVLHQCHLFSPLVHTLLLQSFLTLLSSLPNPPGLIG